MSETIKEKVKQIKLKLVGLDGNAFMLLGKFRQQAQKEGWTKEEIDDVLNEATKGDYTQLLVTLGKHCKNGGF